MAVYEKDEVLAQQMGHPILKPAEEWTLLVRLEQARERKKQIGKGETLFKSGEEKEIALRNCEWEIGEIREELCQKNVRLVMSVAKSYIPEGKGAGFTLWDLMQSGRIGLLKAIDRFQTRRGKRLSTYAVHWIRQSILRDIWRGQPLTVPYHKWEMLRGYGAAYKIREAADLPTDPKTMARELNISEENAKVFDQRIRSVLSLHQSADFWSEDEELSLMSCTPADLETEEEALRLAWIETRNELIEEAFESLTHREAKVIRLRYGMTNDLGKGPMTLDDIAERFGLTRERIRQIEKQALGKLGPIMRHMGLLEMWQGC